MTGYESKRAMAQDKLDNMEREALKLALNVLENLPGFRADIDDAITAIKEALAQPAQEPVAIVAVDVGGQIQVGWIKKPQHNDKLYTTPPQRPLVGLTDEEAQWLYDNCRTPSNLIDMVEARLKDKNT